MADELLDSGAAEGADQGGNESSADDSGILGNLDAENNEDAGVLDTAAGDVKPKEETGSGEDDAGSELAWKDIQKALSGGDDDISRMVARYRSPAAFAKAFAAQRQKIAESSKVPELAENATEEQVAEYRKAMGLPDKFDDYAVGFSEDFKGEDGDDALVKEFAQSMYDNHVPPKYAQAAIDYYQNLMMKGEQNINENAAAVKRETYDALKAEWGKEFDANRNAIDVYLTETMGQDGRAVMNGLRLSDGSSLLDNAHLLRLLAQPARDYVGGEALVSGSMSQTAEDVAKSLNDLMALRLSDPQKYQSASVQKEVAELFERKKRLEGRGATA